MMRDYTPEVFNEGSMSPNGFDYFELLIFCFGPLGRIFRPPKKGSKWPGSRKRSDRVFASNRGLPRRLDI